MISMASGGFGVGKDGKITTVFSLVLTLGASRVLIDGRINLQQLRTAPLLLSLIPFYEEFLVLFILSSFSSRFKAGPFPRL